MLFSGNIYFQNVITSKCIINVLDLLFRKLVQIKNIVFIKEKYDYGILVLVRFLAFCVTLLRNIEIKIKKLKKHTQTIYFSVCVFY